MGWQVSVLPVLGTIVGGYIGGLRILLIKYRGASSSKQPMVYLEYFLGAVCSWLLLSIVFAGGFARYCFRSFSLVNYRGVSDGVLIRCCGRRCARLDVRCPCVRSVVADCLWRRYRGAGDKLAFWLRRSSHWFGRAGGAMLANLNGALLLPALW